MLNPLPLKYVEIDGGFWGSRLRTNREVSLPVEYAQCKATGRIDAFRLNWKPGQPNRPHNYWDSDVAKWIEAAAYSLATHPDPHLEKQVDEVIALIASAQQNDGYLNTYFTVVEPEKRWTNLRDRHELYCAGHLMEAAVAYADATGKKALLETMCRYADYIGKVFGRGKGAMRGYCGHPEIELALVSLYRATGQRRYLELSKYFIDERGRRPHYYDQEARARGEEPASYQQGGYDYLQAHAPVRQQNDADGHAVRACYLYAGMADVAAETDDASLLAACKKMWRSIVDKRMYIHGGIGSEKQGERFTIDYDLPNETAYAETCAAIALFFFAHRMLQIEPDSEYADVMERLLYNGILSGVSFDGTRFYYSNYLASIPGTHRFRKLRSPLRQEWFDCACCPPNLARLLASLGRYIFSQSDDSLHVHLYVNGRAQFSVNGSQVHLRLQTNYPWDADVAIDLQMDRRSRFALALRVPGWAHEVQVTINGKSIQTAKHRRKGYLVLRRTWNAGDQVRLSFPMPVQRVEAHPAVGANCGRVALQRGPLVYCLEEKDNGKALNDILLDSEPAFKIKRGSSGLLKNIPVIVAKASRRERRSWKNALYSSARSPRKSCVVKAIPYFMWANRGEGEMLVWLRQGE